MVIKRGILIVIISLSNLKDKESLSQLTLRIKTWDTLVRNWEIKNDESRYRVMYEYDNRSGAWKKLKKFL